jgi:serine/threonine protein phosphatase PrpC
MPSPRNRIPMEKLDIGTITPAHKLPFMVERHTQQGVDEYHAEENQDRHYIGYDFARKMAWLAIADGHVGSGAADYVTRYVLRHDTVTIRRTRSSFRPAPQPRGAA